MMTKKQMANNFSMQIENVVKENKMSYMDAIVWHSERENIELESVSSLLNKNIKNKLEAEARVLNFLPKRSRLPV